MKTVKAKLILDAKGGAKERRYRNILANSGEIMESGEIRDINNLYVMDYDGKLIKVADLATDPDKQSEHYAVKAQADHGELIDGELVPSIEKQFGSCKVWLEEDGLHARMYFANDQQLADHAWAISEDASYSTGIDWYPDGYYGVNENIDHAIGILREVSMVLTGNDPRAKTIDTKKSADEAQGSKADENGDNKTNEEGEEMQSNKDALTPEERDSMAEKLVAVIDEYTSATDAQPTAKDSEAEAETPAPKEESKDSKHMPVVIVRDRVQQPVAKKTDSKENWASSKEGKRAFADCLYAAGSFNARFDALWSKEVSKHMSLDGINGLPTPIPTQVFESTVEKASGILSKLRHRGGKSHRINLLSLGDGSNIETARAHGHKKGDTKAFQHVEDTVRTVLNKMVYKKLDIDALELYENPELIDFRAQELAEMIISEIERAAIIGDGRTYTSGADYRMFDGTRGFYSIKADAAASTGFGSMVAATFAPTTAQNYNLYDKVVKARDLIKTEGKQFLVAKKSQITAMRLAKETTGAYLIQPGAKLEDILGVSAVFTPSWMDSDTTNDAYLIVEGAYETIGENTMRAHSFFDTTNNTDVLLDETPRGGSLAKYKSAVAIKIEA